MAATLVPMPTAPKADADGWLTLPVADEPVTSVTHSGSGKDADLVIEFVNGKRMEMGVSSLRVETDCGMVVNVTRLDDVTLHTVYTGRHLSLRSGRIRFVTPNDFWWAEFLDDVRAWLESDTDELLYTVDIELQLTSG
jgi:hypothetical protein